jgi:hypothetical protein
LYVGAAPRERESDEVIGRPPGERARQREAHFLFELTE